MSLISLHHSTPCKETGGNVDGEDEHSARNNVFESKVSLGRGPGFLHLLNQAK